MPHPEGGCGNDFPRSQSFVAAVIGFLGTATGIPLAVADESLAATADTPPVAVERFACPGAAGILASEGIELNRRPPDQRRPLTANGATTTVDVAEGGFEPVGEGTAAGARSVLVEIRVTG